MHDVKSYKGEQKMKRVLILGGSGFAGSGLAKRLADRGDIVTILDIVAKAHSDFIDDDRINYKWKSVHDMIPEDYDGQDIVIDLAAQADVPAGFTMPRWTVYENVDGTIAALEAAKDANIDKFIIAGSGNEFGRPIYLPIDEKHPLTPHNPYAFSKAAQEMAGWAYHRCYNVPIVIMSNGACCGAGMRRDIFIFKWLYNILQGKPIYIEGGDQTRDLTYVSDVLDAWMLVIDAPKEKVVGEKFQVSYGEEYSVRELMGLCFDACEQLAETIAYRQSVAVIQKPHRPGEIGQRELFSNQKARDVLGYKPKVAPAEAILKTMEWIKEDVLHL